MSARTDRVVALCAVRKNLGESISTRQFAKIAAPQIGCTVVATLGFLKRLSTEDRSELKIGQVRGSRYQSKLGVLKTARKHFEKKPTRAELAKKAARVGNLNAKSLKVFLSILKERDILALDLADKRIQSGY